MAVNGRLYIIDLTKLKCFTDHLSRLCSCTTMYYGLKCHLNLIIMTSSFGIADIDTGFLPYGSSWRRSRREVEANLRPLDLKSYQPIEKRALHRLLRNLLSSPDNFEQHFRQ